MNTKVLSIAYRRTLGALLLVTVAAWAQAPITGGPSTQRDPLKYSRIVWGAETNGLRCGILHEKVRLRDQIHIYFAKATNTLDSIDSSDHTNSHNWPSRVGDVSAGQYYWDSLEYLSATNNFCGPVELTDEAGKQIVTKEAELTSYDAYPVNIDYIAVVRNELSRPSVSHIVPGKRINFKHGTPQLIASFNLQDMFEVTKSGAYRFKVLPKIYKRSASDRDIFRRIDLPSISIEVELIIPKTE